MIAAEDEAKRQSAEAILARVEARSRTWRESFAGTQRSPAARLRTTEELITELQRASESQVQTTQELIAELQRVSEAQARTNQSVTVELRKVSEAQFQVEGHLMRALDGAYWAGGKIARNVVRLTLIIAIAAMCQIIAAVWQSVAR